MPNEIAITVEGERNPPQFRLSEDRESPRLASVAFVESGIERPLWWIVPTSFSMPLVFTADEFTPEDIDHLASEPFDPIEDLPPSHPRHQAAIEGREEPPWMDLPEDTYPVLGSLIYGVVPPGFRQMAPAGPAPDLIPGRTYAVAVVGPGGHGSAEFQVK